MTFVYVIVEKHENKKYKESSLNIKGIFTEDAVRERLRDDIDVINEHLCENVDERFMLVESDSSVAITKLVKLIEAESRRDDSIDMWFPYIKADIGINAKVYE